MIGEQDGMGPDEDRFAQASAWFARMRGVDADAARDDFEHWRAQPENAQAYREMEAIWAASREAPLRSGTRPAYLRPGLIAAGIGAAITIGLLVWSGQGRETASVATFSSDRGALRTVQLGDGSRVTLDGGSEIRVDLTGDERQVALLSGRGRFVVAHDRTHPFVVTVGENAVVARGTTFEVRARQGRAEVSLIEGAVDLERRERAAPPRLLGRLRPGQKALLGANDSVPEIGSARPDPWATGLRSGEDLRLAAVIAEANRHGGAKIVLDDPAMGDLRFSGAFRPDDTRNLVAGLAAAFDLSIAREPGGDIVLSRRKNGQISFAAPRATVRAVVG